MTSMKKILAALTLSLLVPFASTQTHAAPTTAPAAKQAAKSLTAEEMQDKVLPALDFQTVPLSDFLDFIAAVEPGFQYVVVRDPGVPESYPVLPIMKLKKVTFGQVMAILQQAIPDIEFTPIESEHGSVIYVFKIHGAMSGPNHYLETELKVYRLADAVDAVAARHMPPVPAELTVVPGAAELFNDPAKSAARDAAIKKANDTYSEAVKAVRKEALESVLSLLKASLAQATDQNIAPVIQVHEETQTLILRGSANQIGAVQKALVALTPEAVLAPIRDKFSETEHHYESELAKSADEAARRTTELQAARTEIESLHQELIKLEVAQERMKLQVEAAQKKAPQKE